MSDSLFDLAYPPELRSAETNLLGRTPKFGIAVSGGGIRSATFALGVFQAFARAHVLRKFDCLSTVSGGGYFGTFLGRLFHREYITSVEDVEYVLSGPHPSGGTSTLDQAGWKVLGWLRENGRYLAPRGAGDSIIAAAVVLRNWLSIHITLASFVLGIFLLLQAPRVLWGAMPDAAPRAWISLAGAGLGRLPLRDWLWWSPWLYPSFALFVLCIPAGWAYWLVPRSLKPESSALKSQAAGWAGIAIAAVYGVAAIVFLVLARGYSLGLPQQVAAGMGLFVGIMALGAALVIGTLRSRNARRAADRYRGLSDTEVKLVQDNDIRHDVSVLLTWLLVCAAILLALALIDTFGQTAYNLMVGRQFGAWIAGLLTTLAAFTGIARQLAVMAGGRPGGGRARLPVSIVAFIVAVTLGIVLLTMIDAGAHAITWGFGPPDGPSYHAATGNVTISAPAGQYVQVVTAPGAPAPVRGVGRRIGAVPFFFWVAALLLYAFGLGRAFSFLNQSSHQMLYAARLTRAYLGASNPKRWAVENPVPVVEPVPGDDMEIHEYWEPPTDRPAAASAYAKGKPLHFVNVTVNETYDGQSQIQQQDRKGVGMALGPAGMSLGIRHHVIVRRNVSAGPKLVSHVVVDRVYPEEPKDHKIFRAFNYSVSDPPREFPWDPLSLGRWIGISGAAFSTGLGARTSLGLSLLAGIANVRLGYWWDSGRERDTAGSVKVARWERIVRGSARLFPVQTYLLLEFFSRFSGTAQERWYLSDGGHFENMGGYELVRRRLPLIFVIDAEADPAYTFEGLANLVRKARLDFQTEIRFLEGDELKAALRCEDDAWLQHWGPLNAMRPKVAPARSKDEHRIAYSGARFALAQITYPDTVHGGSQVGHLVYVKPTLTRDDSADVQEYARANPAFPQQTTLDQFFDEAQWESYRRLGDAIGTDLLRARAQGPTGSPEPIVFAL